MIGSMWIDAASKLGRLYAPALMAVLRRLADAEGRELVMEVAPLFSRDCALWRWRDVQILADYPSAARVDAVFPPHPESILLAEAISLPFGGRRFLDIGVGSGILAVVAAKQGWASTGVDINRRALAVADINARLNGVSIALAEDDVEQPKGSWIADLCIANLPFEPTPEGAGNYIHSDGGLYGDRLVSALLRRAGSVIADDGVVIAPAFSLLHGDTSRLESAFAGVDLANFDRAIIRLAEPIELPWLFRARYAREQWRPAYQRLVDEGYSAFVIELGILRKVLTEERGRFLGRFDVIVAGKRWLMPIGARRLGRPGVLEGSGEK